MRRRITNACAVLAALTAGIALAADVTGKWTAQMNGPDGAGMSMTFQFKQEGTRLTGTVEGPGGEMQIQNGKVEGDKIWFTVSFDGGGGEMKIAHEGTIKGDQITLNVRMEGGPGPGGGPGPITLKRTK